MDSNERQRRRELELRRDNEEKDLEVERTIGQRPLEGLSGAHTTWTGEQDDGEARRAHADDEERSERRSEEQVREADDALRGVPEDDERGPRPA